MNPTIDKAAAKKKAEDNARNNDMKQHADKLIQGFEKLSDKHAKRAIWELFQNAIDLASKAKITIELTDEALIFKHNGDPFNDNTLNCLIKQVSSKSGNSNDEEIGQYGTGFITTHSFGRKILLSGSLSQSGYFIPLEEFPIDRTPTKSKDLVENLIKQQSKVFELIENGKYETEKDEWTTFAYQTNSDLEKTYASDALENISLILPYVMVLNEKLQEVLVYDKSGSKKLYEKRPKQKNNGYHETEIVIDGTIKKIYTIEYHNPVIKRRISIILPFSGEMEAFQLHEELPRLFLFYPLTGTERFGINFVIHSKNFRPTEQRDGIHLKSKTEQVQEYEVENRKLISIASVLITDFISKHAEKISNPIHIAEINFKVESENQLLNDYFLSLRQSWSKRFLNYPLVEIENGGRENVSECHFIADELQDEDGDKFESIYRIVNQFYKKIPGIKIARQWSKMVQGWNSDSINWITIQMLVDKLNEAGSLEKFDNKQSLIVTYQFLLDLGKEELFNHNKLLPNIKGEFRKLPDLRESVNLHEILIDIADVLLPEVSKRQIHDEFKFSLELVPYNRRDFSNELNSHIQDTYSESIDFTFFEDKEQNNTFKQTLYKLIDYCKISSSRDSESAPSKMLKLICEYVDYNEELIEVQSIKEDTFELRTSQRRLVNIFLNDLKRKDAIWVENNLQFLKSVLELSGKDEFKELFLKLPAFPNQYHELCVQGALRVDEGIPEEIKEYYDFVVRPDKKIRSTLLLSGLSQYMQSSSKQTTRGLTEEIESVFSEDGQYSNIGDHPYRKLILEIVEKTKTFPEYEKYFPVLFSRRSSILVELADGEDTFSILSLDENSIKKLGDLARNPNMADIIELGEQAVEEAQIAKSDFKFKYDIGKHIEDLIRKKLGKELEEFKSNVEDIQNGQDIMIFSNDDAEYYVEVKSRWDKKNSIMMSKNQFTKAAENKDNYALCCVEMSDYRVGDKERYNVEDVNMILDRIKIINTIGIELEPLIKGIVVNRDVDNEITLTGDYKATIPQKIVKDGSDIDIFVSYLIRKLRLN